MVKRPGESHQARLCFLERSSLSNICSQVWIQISLGEKQYLYAVAYKLNLIWSLLTIIYSPNKWVSTDCFLGAKQWLGLLGVLNSRWLLFLLICYKERGFHQHVLIPSATSLMQLEMSWSLLWVPGALHSCLLLIIKFSKIFQQILHLWAQGQHIKFNSVTQLPN